MYSPARRCILSWKEVFRVRKADCKRKHALRSGSGAAYIGQVGAAHSDGESTLARVVACQLRLTEHAAAEHAQTQARVGSPPSDFFIGARRCCGCACVLFRRVRSALLAYVDVSCSLAYSTLFPEKCPQRLAGLCSRHRPYCILCTLFGLFSQLLLCE